MVARPEPLVRTIPEQRVAYLKGEGAFDRIPYTIIELVTWLTTQGMPTAQVFIGVTYYVRAGTKPTQNIPWEVWGTLPDAIKEATADEGQPGIKTIPSYKGAVMVHLGPYGDTRDSYERLFTWITEQGHQPRGPVYEIYLSDPEEVPIDLLETEIRVPIAG